MRWLKMQKTWITWERNKTFLQNEKIFNLCLRWHILRSCHFFAEATFKYHTQRMERINWICRCRTLCWIFWKKKIKMKYSRSSLDPGDSCCNHQQPYNFLSFFADFRTTQENQNQSIRSRKISCNWEKRFSIISKGKILRADRKKSFYF